MWRGSRTEHWFVQTETTTGSWKKKKKSLHYKLSIKTSTLGNTLQDQAQLFQRTAKNHLFASLIHATRQYFSFLDYFQKNVNMGVIWDFALSIHFKKIFFKLNVLKPKARSIKIWKEKRKEKKKQQRHSFRRVQRCRRANFSLNSEYTKTQIGSPDFPNSYFNFLPQKPRTGDFPLSSTPDCPTSSTCGLCWS